MELLTTIATVPAVIALVTLLKKLGLPSKFGALAAVLLGVAVVLLDTLSSGRLVNWYELAATGIILGLSASGLYDGAKVIGAKSSSTVVEETIIIEEDGPVGHSA